MIDFKDIPGEDRVCINCEYFVRQNLTDMGPHENYCHGKFPCSNFRGRYSKNYFIPDDLYLQDKYGCDACEHYYGGEPSEECGSCCRWYEDNWRRQR